MTAGASCLVRLEDDTRCRIKIDSCTEQCIDCAFDNVEICTVQMEQVLHVAHAIHCVTSVVESIRRQFNGYLFNVGYVSASANLIQSDARTSSLR